MAEQTNSILVDQSESIVATIGSNYLQNFLTGGNVEKGVGILTQKRFYYKGKNLGGAGRNATSTVEEGVVSIEDITFSLFTHTRYIGALIFAIFLTLLGVVCVFIHYYIAIAVLALTLPFYLKYFLTRQSLFLVAFAGGSFSYDISWYPISDFRDFQRQLHLLKDHIKEVQA